METVKKPKETDENEKYKQCCLFDRGNCGPYKRIKPGIFEMKHLNIDVKIHQVDLKIMQSSDRNKWHEMK